MFFNYLVSFDLINAFQKGRLVSPQLCKVNWNKKRFKSHRIGLGHQHGLRFIFVRHQYGEPEVMWIHVDFGYRTFDRLGRQTVTSGHVVVFQCQITKTRVSQLRKLREYIVSCYKPFSWTEKAVETFNQPLENYLSEWLNSVMLLRMYQVY